MIDTTTTTFAEVKMVPLGKLLIDKDYQRPLTDRWEKMAGEKFDPVLFGVLTGSARRGGKVALVDGMHRGEGALNTPGVDAVPVMVHHNLTRAEEALLFVKLQMTRAELRPLDKYKADLFAKVPAAHELRDTALRHGFEIRRARSNDSYGLEAVACLYGARKRGNLDATLGFAALMQPRGRKITAALIKGVSVLLERTPTLDPTILGKVLIETGMNGIDAEAKSGRYKRSSNGGAGHGMVYAEVIADLYTAHVDSLRIGKKQMARFAEQMHATGSLEMDLVTTGA